jgi:hypothetical protein
MPAYSETTSSSMWAMNSPCSSEQPNPFRQARACLEVFAIHLRTLLDFLYMDARSARDSDVIAADFFASEKAAIDWAAKRGAIPDTLRDAKRRADKQVGHLTTPLSGQSARGMYAQAADQSSSDASG